MTLISTLVRIALVGVALGTNVAGAADVVQLHAPVLPVQISYMHTDDQHVYLETDLGWRGVTRATGAVFAPALAPAEYKVEMRAFAPQPPPAARNTTYPVSWQIVHTVFGNELWQQSHDPNADAGTQMLWTKMETPELLRQQTQVRIIPTHREPIIIAPGMLWLPNSINPPSYYPRKGKPEHKSGYRSMKLPPDRMPMQLGALGPWPSIAQYHNHRLWLGYNELNAGKAGIGLFVIDIHEQDIEALKNDPSPLTVNGIKLHGPDLWVAFGDVRSPTRRSELWRLNHSGTIRSSDALLFASDAQSMMRRENFDYPPTVFLGYWPLEPAPKATSYRSRNRPVGAFYLLTQDFGPIQYQPKQGRYGPEGDFAPAPKWDVETAFDWYVEPDRKTAWIATRKEGLLRYNLQSRSYERINLRPKQP